GAAVADVVVHHRRELIDGSGPADDEVTAGVCVAEEDARQGGAFVLRAVRHVQDGGDVLLRPVDGVRKAGDEQHDGARLHGEDLLDELLLLEGEGFAVAAFTTVGGNGAGERAAAVDGLVPVACHVRAAGGVVADDNDGDVRVFSGGDGLLSELAGGVVDFDVGAKSGLDTGERRDGVGRRAATPLAGIKAALGPDVKINYAASELGQ